jgi:outer membrane immunogenic protein
MKKFLLTGVALAALACGPALAADLPVRGVPVKAPEPVMVYGYNWSGFYIGAHGGGGWSNKCFTFAGDSDGCHDGDGWLAGGQVGFNWQTNNIVFGVEFSGSAADISGDHHAFSDPADTFRSKVNSLFLLTGRVGFAFDRMLLYVTGGGAWARDKYEFVDVGQGTLTYSAKQNRTGWTIGAGLEIGLTPNWSLAAQYNFVDLGDRDVTFSAPGATFAERVDQELHIATVRLNYRFGGFGGPIAARY